MPTSMPTDRVRSVFADWLREGAARCGHPAADVEFAIGCVARWPGFEEDSGTWRWAADQMWPPFLEFRGALALIPGDCEWTLGGDKSEPVCPTAMVWRWDEAPDADPGTGNRADMPTPEEALCAAALKARKRARDAGQPVPADPDWSALGGEDGCACGHGGNGGHCECGHHGHGSCDDSGGCRGDGCRCGEHDHG
jgi:hypothetical protein